jgi:hypothetical protein
MTPERSSPEATGYNSCCNVGAQGSTFISAVDGSGRDKVVCNSTQNAVEIDQVDELCSNCAMIVVAPQHVIHKQPAVHLCGARLL